MQTILSYESSEDGETCIAVCDHYLKSRADMITWLLDNDYAACYVIKFSYEPL